MRNGADPDAGVRTGYWFVPKRYGFGATPATWQGWLAMVVFAGALIAAMRLLPQGDERFAICAALIAGFCILAACKTDGGLGWRWGTKQGR